MVTSFDSVFSNFLICAVEWLRFLTERFFKSNFENSIQIEDKPEKFTNKNPGAVNSPMVGTAYSSPEPGKETFVKLNSSVSKGDTLLIIEAMKVMNSITAHKSGKVVFIGFEDSQPIEFDQLLVVIE